MTHSDAVAEHKAAFAAGLLETPESFDQGYGPFLEALLGIADTDRDGLLTEGENWPLGPLPDA
ncbi:hypothetical protein [Actinokineospora iranica]|uniref:Uncharacterized protein n=1 Tax=Actinokineospora iranica TaxID=1271860 RepID=A0A1G6IUS0_9PSEU|nr:hypothetical protein [Actinokineospora iranica]SDC09765.1 hypothetical protein SAMN05216174_10193 [Actinokineospora iranica]